MKDLDKYEKDNKDWVLVFWSFEENWTHFFSNGMMTETLKISFVYDSWKDRESRCSLVEERSAKT